MTANREMVHPQGAVAPQLNQPAVAVSPFGARPTGWKRYAHWVAYAGVPAVVIAMIYLATRSRSEVVASPPGHDHASPPATDSARPVMLSAEEARRIGVTYAVATVGAISTEIRTVGQVTFDERRVTTIAPKTEGWVEKLHVNFTGQLVEAGTPLLDLYSPMLVTAQEELLLARKLASDVAGGSDEARASAAELLSSARRRLAYWDIPAEDVARVEGTGQVQRTLTLRAPVSGSVIEKNVLQGQRIMAGDALYRIADLDTVWVEGEVFEQDLSSLRLGQSVAAELQSLPGQELAGRIAFINPTLNPDTRTVRVRVELPNPAMKLKPGMYATLHFAGASRAGAVSVPRSAVLSTGQRNLVFVKNIEGLLEPRLVELGVATSDRVQIVRGLSGGETVVSSATFLIDAESNLGSALGGMANMPGMDMTSPKKKPSPVKRDTADMSGMDMGAPTKKPTE